MQKRLNAIISGRVQGVGFRFFAEAEALLVGVAGFARNLPDGRVEVVAEGDEANLKKFLKALEKGPPTSHVEEAKASWGNAKGEFSGFSIKY